MSRSRTATQVLRDLARGVRSLSGSSAASKACPGETLPPISNAHKFDGTKALDIPNRFLMGPGPANAYPRILAAQAMPLLGHLHPPLLKIMDECQEGLRYLFQTDSKYTLLVSGTGHAGMEAAIANLLEPGETIVVGNKGVWGTRVCDLSERYGAKVVDMKGEGGKAFDLATIEANLKEHKPAVLFLCQGESSTGVHQSLAGLGDLCKKYDTLLLVDTVCSLGGVPLYADDWGVDCIYSGSQKCLSAPPGASPFFFSERALQKLMSRKTKPATFNLDMTMIGDYWGWWDKRSYHHTGVVSTFYAMREAFAIVNNEGLEAMWKRHQDMHEMLWEGLTKFGLKPYVEDDAARLATVNTIRAPDGVDIAKVIGNAMEKYSVEISAGLGPSAGKVWRIGLMGMNARPQNVRLVLNAFEDGLKQQKFL
ncbi:unnamed protein product [Pedinophyceae sp. YPF-701]|nr:unnamed protein product [Pedinophyceae sp. YPF-701]